MKKGIMILGVCFLFWSSFISTGMADPFLLHPRDSKYKRYTKAEDHYTQIKNNLATLCIKHKVPYLEAFEIFPEEDETWGVYISSSLKAVVSKFANSSQSISFQFCPKDKEDPKGKESILLIKRNFYKGGRVSCQNDMRYESYYLDLSLRKIYTDKKLTHLFHRLKLMTKNQVVVQTACYQDFQTHLIFAASPEGKKYEAWDTMYKHTDGIVINLYNESRKSTSEKMGKATLKWLEKMEMEMEMEIPSSVKAEILSWGMRVP